MTFVSPNIQIDLPILTEKKVNLYIKREDLIHPLISGNKFRKLKYNLEEAKRLGKTQLVTFGGAYSNHILATAAAGKEYGFKTVGIIRGEELGKNRDKTLVENSTLSKAFELEMELDFVSREDYKLKNDLGFIERVHKKYFNSYILPEGGTNELAIKGCEEILIKEDEKFTHIAVAMGTGGTATGLINSSLSSQEVLVFPALKGRWCKDEIQDLKPRKNNWKIINNYHFGGYAKISNELIIFMNMFKKSTGIPLEPIYTGKLVYGIIDMIKEDYFPVSSKILAIHTGGLQGIVGINKQLTQKELKITE